ncbi:MAG: hypothetical protein AAB637_02050 [Patescibacteria group bacterium]
MKKPLILLIVLVIVGIIIWKFNSKTVVAPQVEEQNPPTTVAPSNEPFVPISEKTKVSDKVSEYKNGELGFTVKYPSLWKVEESPYSVTFVTPVDTSSKNSINKLESKIAIISGKCSFPPVTTIKERVITKIAVLPANMISMSNSVQGKNYFDRMYTLQKGTVCYVFSFSSISLNPSSKGFSGGEVQQVNANNKAIIESTDTQFKDLVKSFAFVIGPAGMDESKASPASSTPKKK